MQDVLIFTDMLLDIARNVLFSTLMIAIAIVVAVFTVYVIKFINTKE